VNKTLAERALRHGAVAATQQPRLDVPHHLSGNNTGEPNATFLGAPDDDYSASAGLGGHLSTSGRTSSS